MPTISSYDRDTRLPASQLPERDQTTLRFIRPQSPPGWRIEVIHLATSSDPLALAALQLGRQSIWLENEAQE